MVWLVHLSYGERKLISCFGWDYFLEWKELVISDRWYIISRDTDMN